MGAKLIESVGGYGYTVGIWSRDGSSNLYLRQGERWESLGHADLEAAREEAKRRSAAALAPRGIAGGRRPRLGELLTLYELHVTPTKESPAARKEDKRRIDLWRYVLGDELDPLKLTGLALKAFERARAAGTIKLPDYELRPARANTIRQDLAFLRAVLNWAASMQSNWLLERNPMEGYSLPVEVNRRTPRAYWEDYLELQKVARRVNPLFGPFMALVESLGWRVGAVCELWAADFDPMRTKTRKHGRLLKRSESDKMGVERWTVISSDARAALEELLQLTGRVGRSWLFPSVKDPNASWTRHYAKSLLEKAYEDAKVPKERRVGFHAYRRKWVDERKHWPAADVAAQGAWLSQRTLEIYQQPDEDTLQAIADEPRKLKLGTES